MDITGTEYRTNFRNLVNEELSTCSQKYEWQKYKDILVKAAFDICGKTGNKRQHQRETYWWNSDVQNAILEKRLAFKKWQKSKMDIDRQVYKEKNRDAKRSVALAREKQCEKWLSKSKGDQLKDLYRIAKQTALAKKDTVGSSCLKNDDGNILTSDKDIKNQWKTYFYNLLNETNPVDANFDAEAVEGPITNINPFELETAINKMKAGKAAGPSGLVVDIISAAGKAGIEGLLKICQKFWTSGEMPSDWLTSITVPLYKGKGDA